MIQQYAMSNKVNGNLWVVIAGNLGSMGSLLGKLNYSADTASVASRQATAWNIADSAVTRLQPISNTRNDAAVVWDHVTFRATFRFQPTNGGAYILPSITMNFVIFASI